MTELAKRMKTAEPSIVRELYKVWTLPGMHSLGAGNPSLKTFPVKQGLFCKRAGVIVFPGPKFKFFIGIVAVSVSL